MARHVVRDGILIGFAGGLAEVLVVCFYTTATAGNAADVARGVARAAGFDGAATGLAVHMGLAAALGVALLLVIGSARVLPFMLASLAAVWAINFLAVLPAMGSDFVHLLPYTVTFASKLAFGLAAAGALAWIRGLAIPRVAAGAMPAVDHVLAHHGHEGHHIRL